MSISIHGTNGVTFNDGSLQKTSAQTGFRNRIINGDMRIDQRNAGASVTPANASYVLDRWRCYLSQASKYSVQRNAGTVTPPVGFTNYLGVTSLSSYSVGASEIFSIQQFIEGFNVSDLGWGTANAQAVTLSFKVYSSLTGTFGGVLENDGQNRSYPFTYAISSANTWTTISITVAGDTSGTWLTNNGRGIGVWFGLGVGSTLSGTAGSWSGTTYYSVTGATSVVGTSGATFYITGVQLEAGSTATEFERRPIGTELALCQRYLQTWGGNSLYERVAFGYAVSTINVEVFLPRFSVPMRTAPSLNANSPSNFRVSDGGGSTTLTSISISQSAPNSCGIVAQVASGLTTYRAMSLDTNTTLSALLQLGAEL